MTGFLFEVRCVYCGERVSLSSHCIAHGCQDSFVRDFTRDGSRETVCDEMAQGKFSVVTYHRFPRDPPFEDASPLGRVERFIGAVRAFEAMEVLLTSQRNYVSDEKKKAITDEYNAAMAGVRGPWTSGRFEKAIAMIDAAFILNGNAPRPYLGQIGQLTTDDPVAREYFAAKDELIKSLEASDGTTAKN